MKILLVSQRYWPENFRITDIAETLVKLGNDVTVLTGLPNYPKGYIFDEYKHNKNRIQIHNGVKIIRAKEIGRRNNIFFRFLNYYSFTYYANKLIKKLDKDFDIVLINELSPIMCARPGIKYAKKYHTPILMYEMDLWPESLLAGGIKKNSILYKHYKKVSAKIYSSCDKILVSTKEHIDYIHNLPNCKDIDIEYLPQYAEDIFEKMEIVDNKNNTVDLLFAGNIGKAQSLDTIINVANLVKNNKKYLFHIVGDGSELNNIKDMANKFKLKNVIFYGSNPLSEMPSYYNLADLMIVTLEDSLYANMTIPGKVQTYMAVGKPIIACANGATANLINESKSGFVINSKDYKTFAKTIENISDDDLKLMGINSRKYYDLHFCKDKFFTKLINTMDKMRNKF